MRVAAKEQRYERNTRFYHSDTNGMNLIMDSLHIFLTIKLDEKPIIFQHYSSFLNIYD
jgi:hypothetical protein